MSTTSKSLIIIAFKREKKLSIEVFIIEIDLARHADLDANLQENVLVIVGRVLESLFSVNDYSSHVRLLLKNFLKGLKNLMIENI